MDAAFKDILKKIPLPRYSSIENEMEAIALQKVIWRILYQFYRCWSFFTKPCMVIQSFWISILLTSIAEFNNQDSKLLYAPINLLLFNTKKLNEVYQTINLTNHAKVLNDKTRFGKKTSTLVNNSIKIFVYVPNFVSSKYLATYWQTNQAFFRNI